jgi:hypothetical protein
VRSCFDQGQNHQAIGLLRKALALDPKYADAQALIAYRLMMEGNTYGDPANIDKGIAEAAPRCASIRSARPPMPSSPPGTACRAASRRRARPSCEPWS